MLVSALDTDTPPAVLVVIGPAIEPALPASDPVPIAKRCAVKYDRARSYWHSLHQRVSSVPIVQVASSRNICIRASGYSTGSENSGNLSLNSVTLIVILRAPLSSMRTLIAPLRPRPPTLKLVRSQHPCPLIHCHFSLKSLLE
jgi:hypothetical protein